MNQAIQNPMQNTEQMQIPAQASNKAMGLETMAEEIQSGLSELLPYVSAKKNLFLGTEYIDVVASFQPKDSWFNGYIENTDFFKVALRKREDGDFALVVHCQPRFAKVRIKNYMTAEKAVSYMIAQFKKAAQNKIEAGK